MYVTLPYFPRGGGATETWAGLVGDQGDWSPSLFVSDVPDVAYFEQT